MRTVRGIAWRCSCGAVGGEKECNCGKRGLGLRRAALQSVGALLLLAGCAAPAPAPVVQTRIQVERVTLPAGLLSCSDEPPVTAYALQSQVATYIVRLREAYQDCRNTVASVAQIEATPAGK